MIALIPLAILALLVIGGIMLVRRISKGRGGGASADTDLIPYALLALAVGAAGYALAELGRAAFPGDRFVFDSRQQVATSLATMVVAVPVALYLWRRQARRRATQPASSGWTLYLTLITAGFLIPFVIAAFQLFEWLLGEGSAPAWTDVIVFGGVVALHEVAIRRTPPVSDAADLPRVVGSAVGLVPTVIGLGGLLFWVLDRLYSTLAATAGGLNLGTSLALLLVGAPVWAYYWLRPWREEPGTPRKAWIFLVSVGGPSSALGSLVAITISVLLFMFTASEPAGAHFDAIPAEITVLAMGLLVWWHHRGRLGEGRTDPKRAYEYAMAAIGLLGAVGFATALASSALAPDLLVGAGADDVITLAVALVASISVWWWFWSKASREPREIVAVSGPRRVYLLGLGIVMGLVAAGALIGTLFVLFRRLLDVSTGGDSLAVQAALFVFAGAAAWHLLQTHFQDRSLIDADEVITPFDVTLICSHPGMIATTFPKEARVRVVYRADDLAPIDTDTAEAIVAAVGHRSSLVWVDEDGFRVAPAR